MTLRFTKPSLSRLVSTIIAVVLLACAITGIALAIAFIKGHNGAVPNGEYVRVIVTSLTIWAPIYLLIAWPLSIPAIIVLGVFGACVRRRPADAAADEQL